MLLEFIAQNRDVIIARTRDRVASRVAPRPTLVEISYGVPLFLEQLSSRLQTDIEPGATQIGVSASLHGSELLNAGFTIGQVVHDYGNICQVITDLAVELRSPITNEDFRTLNLCLDIAIAEAVTEFARQREQSLIGQGVEQLGFLAHELRNLLNSASLAFEAVRSGNVGIGGSTGTVLETSLAKMRDLLNLSLAEVRLEAGPPRDERILVSDFLEEIEISATLQANSRGVHLSIEPAESGVAVDGDYQILASVVTNLIQNACKFSRARGLVTLRTHVTADRVGIAVADECGGLPLGMVDDLFRPYEQRGRDRSGLGLGLAISLKGARAIGGDIHVRDIPGTGCVFTVDLRRSA